MLPEPRIFDELDNSCGCLVGRGFVASWRPINLNRPAVRVGGSPFKTLAEAEKACEAMLVNLTT